MTFTRGLILALTIGLFLAAKLYFLFHVPKSLAIAAIPAVLLILSTPQDAGATEPAM